MIGRTNMQRRLAASGLALALTFGLGACDDSAGSTADSGAKPTAASPKENKTKKEGIDKSKLLAEATPADADPSDEFAGFDPRVVTAAQIARDIEADPAKADAVLETKGLDRDGLDALMFEIARDPDLTGQYRIARGL